MAQQRWLYKLMGFDFVVEYKKGRENIVANALSRRFEEDSMGEFQAICTPFPNWLEAIKEEVKNNEFFHGVKSKIEQDEVVGPWEL